MATTGGKLKCNVNGYKCNNMNCTKIWINSNEKRTEITICGGCMKYLIKKSHKDDGDGKYARCASCDDCNRTKGHDCLCKCPTCDDTRAFPFIQPVYDARKNWHCVLISNCKCHQCLSCPSDKLRLMSIYNALVRCS